MAEETKQNFAEMINAVDADGWVRAMGIHLTHATRDEIRAEMTVGPQHRQALGIVHGGVHAGIIETICSIGAAIDVIPTGKGVVGLENHTSFLRAVREGTLRATAKPLTRGRRSQVWEASIHDEQGRLVATGRVRLMVIDQGDALGGAPMEVPAAMKP